MNLNPTSNGLTRRSIIGGGLATAGLLASTRPAAASDRKPVQHGNTTSRTRVVLLGTAGGPTYMPGAKSEGISSAVVVGDRYYIIDAGDGVLRQARNARLGTWQHPLNGPLDQLRAVFLTHLHSDHITDLSALLNAGLFNGLQKADLPVKLIGPGNRGVLPPLFGEGAAPPVVAPPKIPHPARGRCGTSSFRPWRLTSMTVPAITAS
ncbi:MBL fold metallo-hydrolase [Arthrobacter sp. Marseille-P9274]|uniref:MBL fold metallo-hydrolase n=1 Tax=Arthrobacter sp. Marseille-P9274 TaxID=2866572 RepID=UPI0034D24032